MREIGIGHANVLAARRTYVGELGWELFVPVELATGVYDAIMQAGADLGVRDGGYYAIESLRLEKGYRAWGTGTHAGYYAIRGGLELCGQARQGRFSSAAMRW